MSFIVKDDTRTILNQLQGALKFHRLIKASLCGWAALAARETRQLSKHLVPFAAGLVRKLIDAFLRFSVVIKANRLVWTVPRLASSARAPALQVTASFRIRAVLLSCERGRAAIVGLSPIISTSGFSDASPRPFCLASVALVDELEHRSFG